MLAGLAGPTLAEPGDIIFARAQGADSLDTARVTTTISSQVMTQIYESLLSLDDKGHVVGGLAQSYAGSPDNMSFTFKMRPGIKCHVDAVRQAARDELR